MAALCSSICSIKPLPFALRAVHNRNARSERVAPLTCVAASGDNLCVVTGAANSTGRLVAGLLVAKLGGDNVALVVPEGQQDSYWPVEMPDDVVLKRYGAPAEELLKAQIVNYDEAKVIAAKAKTMLFVHESGNAQSEQVPLLHEVSAGFRRAILLSRVGVSRRDQKPFDEQNQPPNNLMQIGLGINIPAGKQEGIPGTLDAFAEAEKILNEAANAGGWEACVVRSGELRGNGPLLLADLSSRLVDNMYDVNFQDLYLSQGDTTQGYTKRLNLAAMLTHLVDRATVPEDFACLSVVCEMAGPMGVFGERQVTNKTDVERRKGYDMSKGRAPAAIDAEALENLLVEL